MKICMNFIIVTIFYLTLVFGLMWAQEQQKEELKQQIPAVPKVLLPDTIQIKDFLNKQSAYKVRDDISVDFDMTVNIEKKTATQNYLIKNLINKTIEFQYTTPSMDYKMRLLKLAPKKTKKESLTKEISIAQLTNNTKFIQIRPYILLKDSVETDFLLVTDYNVNIEVQLPLSAKILKSSVPLSEKQNNVYTFNLDHVKIVPPIYLWYTTSEANINISKEIKEEDNKVKVEIEVKNVGQISLKNIIVTTQFPATLYTYVPEESDGDILLQDEIMYRWSMKIENLIGNTSQQFHYTVEKINQIPYHDYELAVYDDKGELIGVK